MDTVNNTKYFDNDNNENSENYEMKVLVKGTLEKEVIITDGSIVIYRLGRQCIRLMTMTNFNK